MFKINPIEIINNLDSEYYMDWGDDFSFDDLFKKPDLDNEVYKASFVKRHKPYNNICLLYTSPSPRD